MLRFSFPLQPEQVRDYEDRLSNHAHSTASYVLWGFEERMWQHDPSLYARHRYHFALAGVKSLVYQGVVYILPIYGADGRQRPFHPLLCLSFGPS